MAAAEAAGAQNSIMQDASYRPPRCVIKKLIAVMSFTVLRGGLNGTPSTKSNDTSIELDQGLLALTCRIPGRRDDFRVAKTEFHEEKSCMSTRTRERSASELDVLEAPPPLTH